MDRDRRWERTERYYRCRRATASAPSGRRATRRWRPPTRAGVTDEFVEPAVVRPRRRPIAAGDELVFFNFRPDRARAGLRARWPTRLRRLRPRPAAAAAATLTTMTAYWDGQPGAVAFGEVRPDDVLADVLERAGISPAARRGDGEVPARDLLLQRRARGTSTPARARAGASPRDVATYDLKPEMSAVALADARRGGARDAARIDFAVVNFANPDMVGHTGVIPAVDPGRRDRRRAARPGARRRRGRGRRGASSPPTTATPSRCWRRTARRTPRTPRTRCRSWSRSTGCALREGGRLATSRRRSLELLGLRSRREMTGRSLLIPAVS